MALTIKSVSTFYGGRKALAFTGSGRLSNALSMTGKDLVSKIQEPPLRQIDRILKSREKLPISTQEEIVNQFFNEARLSCTFISAISTSLTIIALIKGVLLAAALSGFAALISACGSAFFILRHEAYKKFFAVIKEDPLQRR